jgi:hypothetical protein
VEGLVANTIRRRVLFFTTTLTKSTEDGDVLCEDQGLAWKRLARMKFTDKGDAKGRSRFITESVVEAVDVKPLPSGGPGYYGRFHRTKYSDFPLIGRGEEDAPLRLDTDQGLRHPAHFVWWDLSKKKEIAGVPAPQLGLLGIELNMAGPRAAGLEPYILNRFEGALQMSVLPLFDPETWDHIMSLRYVKSITARVLSYRPLHAKEGNLAGLDVPDQLDNVREFSWTVKPKKRRRFDLMTVADRMRGLITSQDDVRIVIMTEDGQAMDVAESRVTGVEWVQPASEGSRHVNPLGMYGAIKDAYGKYSDRIARGLGRYDTEG